jgi:hypothetical protein
MRARGVGWPTVAQHVKRRESICRRWEVRYRDEWQACYETEKWRRIEEINVAFLLGLTDLLAPHQHHMRRKKAARYIHEWMETSGPMYLVSHPSRAGNSSKLGQS